MSNESETAGESGCPSCGTPFRVRAKFCDTCGLALAGQSSKSSIFDTSAWTLNPGRYGLFGWFETALGLIATILGIASLYAFQNPGVPLTALRIAEAVFIGFDLAIFTVVAVQRYFYKELFAFVFAIAAVAGAICAMIVVVSHSLTPGSFLIVFLFGWLMASGVKLLWLCLGDFGPAAAFRVEEHPLFNTRAKLFLLAGVTCLVNFVGFVLQLYILTSTFEEV